jgi:hypothetical protein
MYSAQKLQRSTLDGHTACSLPKSLAALDDATSISKEIPKLASAWITSVNLEQLPTEDGSS